MMAGGIKQGAANYHLKNENPPTAKTGGNSHIELLAKPKKESLVTFMIALNQAAKKGIWSPFTLARACQPGDSRRSSLSLGKWTQSGLTPSRSGQSGILISSAARQDSHSLSSSGLMQTGQIAIGLHASPIPLAEAISSARWDRSHLMQPLVRN